MPEAGFKEQAAPWRIVGTHENRHRPNEKADLPRDQAEVRETVGHWAVS